MYLDSAYIAKEGWLSPTQFREFSHAFLRHADSGVWTLIPATEPLLKRMSSLISAVPAGVYLRAGDAVHLTTRRSSANARSGPTTGTCWLPLHTSG